MKNQNSKGQFYLMAAIIIVVLVIGFATVSNYSKSETSTKIYDLGEELGIESAKVLDYGKYNGLTETNMSNLLKTFMEAYSQYGEIEKLYFIFGNAQKITVYGYHELEEETIGVAINEEAVSDLNIDKQIIKEQNYNGPIDKVTIYIGEIPYEFELKPGENFYFIIVLTDEGEQYVYVGGK